MLNLCLAVSLHLLPGDWNAIHPCLVYEQDQIKTGVYYNSERSLSAFVARDFGSFELGVVTGYKGMPIAPMIRLTHEVSEDTELFLMPAATVDGDIGAVLGIQVTFK